MSEYQIFCYSKVFNDENSFQQKRYRAFNKEVGKGRYNEIKSEVEKILGMPFKQLLDFWKDVTFEQWSKLLAILEAKDFKEGFEYIANVEIGEPQIVIAGSPVEIFKDKIKVGCTEVTLDTIDKIIQKMKKVKG